ncbi:hypothetical protein H4R34_002051 [Dimargaris verticillata]|uniref:COP9 signalosome complex subunit 4 n=1 Tax=Dimargaris verticillata TaxID=2761393 RepID=A0A9W8B793_9FUNG|nr:hypothetical protein H4R34_002051 [Dimargaris verticillata]
MDNATLREFVQGTSDPIQWTPSYLDQVLEAVTHGDSQSTTTATQRDQLTQFLTSLAQRSVEPTVEIQALESLLTRLRPRAASFEDVLHQTRERLADLYEGREDWALAIRTLQGMSLESGQRQLGPEYKLRTYLRVARLCLKDSSPTSLVEAETCLNRASHVVPDCPVKSLQVEFQHLQAQSLDHRHRFLDACTKYYQLSTMPELAKDERDQMLSQAMLCAIMAGAGPRRSRMLAVLCKDERTGSSPHVAFINQLLADRLLSQEQIAALQHLLPPHYLTPRDDGHGTMFDHAIWEHNILAASKLYINVTFASLAQLLGSCTEQQVEQLAARMIEQGRLQATIDQPQALIEFGRTNGTDTSSDTAHHQLDQDIQLLCQSVEDIVTQIQAKHPNFVQAALGS